MHTSRNHDKDCFVRSNDIELIEAATGPSGTQYFHFRQMNLLTWVAADLFNVNQGPGLDALKARGIKIYDGADRAALVKQMKATTSYPSRAMVERVGWNDLLFGYPNGQAIGPNSDTTPVGYTANVICVGRAGTLEDWIQNVAVPIAQEPLVLFSIIVALAAPVLKLSRIQGNFGLMLVGPPGRGKTTCLDVAASTCGPSADDDAGRYYLKFNNTMNRIEQWMPQYSDMPLIVDELSSLGSKSSRESDMRTLIHHLAGVEQRGRQPDELKTALQVRTIFFITSNDALQDLLNRETPDAAAGASERLFEIPLPDTEAGVFCGVRTGQEAHQLAERLHDAVALYHGTAMPAMIENLACERERDPEAFRERLHHHMARFANDPDILRLGHLPSRLIQAFSLIYAAGDFARYKGLLTAETDVRGAVIHALHLHLKKKTETDPIARLFWWMLEQPTIDLQRQSLPEISDTDLAVIGAFIGVRNGKPQLWVHPTLFNQAFAQSLAMRKALLQRGVLRSEGRGKNSHHATHARVRSNLRQDRVYAFELPGLTEWLREHRRELRVLRRSSRQNGGSKRLRA